MAANIKGLVSFFFVKWVFWDKARRVAWLQLENDSVHAVDGAWLAACRKKLLAAHCAGHDVAYKGVALREVSGEVHLFPFVSLLDSEPREAEVGADGVRPYEVDLAILGLGVNVFWVLLFIHFLHIEHLRVVV